MKHRPVLGILVAVAAGVALLVGSVGCNRSKKSGATPTFTLAWSEYPSWSVFGVAQEKGVLEKMEKKWGVKIKLELLTYENCINQYQTKNVDAVCITNMDVLAPSLSRNSVAVLPTSTSYGADACLVAGIKDVDELRKHKVYGLKESVSEYAFFRNLQLLGKDASDYQFTNMDPGEAAKQMQAKVKEVKAIMVWNPFVLQTLHSRPEAKRLFDSTKIPEEIIDMVVVGEDVLKKPGGKDFACAVIDAYYEFNTMLADAPQREDLLVALGEKFSSLKLKDMEKAVDQTRFYKTADEGLNLFTGTGKLSKRKLPDTMKMVVDFYLKHKFIKKGPKISYGDAEDSEADLRFDPSFMRTVKNKK